MSTETATTEGTEVAAPELPLEASASEETEVVEQPESVKAEESGDAEAKSEAEKPKGKVNPFRHRISELTAQSKERERALEEARARIAELERANQKPQESVEEVEVASDLLPASVVRDLAIKEGQRIAAEQQFNTNCNKAFEDGIKSYTDFKEAMDNFGALGGLETDVIEDALATGAAHQVLYDLGNNLDEAVRLLKLPRARRIAEFTKMTLKTAPKPAVSRASPPIKPLNGNAKKDFDPMDTSIPDEEWHRQEDERERNRRRA